MNFFKEFFYRSFPICDRCHKRTLITNSTYHTTDVFQCKFCAILSFLTCKKCTRILDYREEGSPPWYEREMNQLVKNHIQEEHSSVELV